MKYINTYIQVYKHTYIQQTHIYNMAIEVNDIPVASLIVSKSD